MSYLRLLFIVIVLNSNNSFAQDHKSLQGKWRIVALYHVTSASQDSVYFDIDKDSIYIPAQEYNEAKKNGQDSIQTVTLFKYMYSGFKNSSITFSKDSVFLDYSTGKTIGTYHIDRNTLNLKLSFKDEEQDPIVYKFVTKNKELILLQTEDVGYKRIILLKQ